MNKLFIRNIVRFKNAVYYQFFPNGNKKVRLKTTYSPNESTTGAEIVQILPRRTRRIERPTAHRQTFGSTTKTSLVSSCALKNCILITIKNSRKSPKYIPRCIVNNSIRKIVSEILKFEFQKCQHQRTNFGDFQLFPSFYGATKFWQKNCYE